MNIPNYVQDKLVDEKGFITPSWQQFFTQLIQELQKNAGNEGLVAPSQTNGNLSTIKTNAQNGTLLYDSTNDKLNVRLSDGNFHVITTS